MTGVLAAAVGMMDQARRRLSQIDGHHQGADHQRLFHAPIDRPTHHAAGIKINDHGQIDPTLLSPEVRDIRAPGSVRCRRRKIPIQHVPRHWKIVLTVRRYLELALLLYLSGWLQYPGSEPLLRSCSPAA